MEYTDVRQIREIISGTEATYTEKLVNAYLARGWILLAIQQQDNGPDTLCTRVAYILGHADANAEHVEVQPDSTAEAPVAAGKQFVPGAFLWG